MNIKNNKKQNKRFACAFPVCFAKGNDAFFLLTEKKFDIQIVNYEKEKKNFFNSNVAFINLKRSFTRLVSINKSKRRSLVVVSTRRKC